MCLHPSYFTAVFSQSNSFSWLAKKIYRWIVYTELLTSCFFSVNKNGQTNVHKLESILLCVILCGHFLSYFLNRFSLQLSICHP